MSQHIGNKLVVWLIIHYFNNHKTTRNGGGALMYEYLIKEKYMDYNPIQVRENLNRAIKNNLHLANLFKGEAIKKSPTVINEAKALCVDDFFIDLKINGVKIERLLHKNINLK